MRKISKRDREIMAKTVLIRPPNRGKIDPREMRKTLKALYAERAKAEAEAKAKAKAEKNGKAHRPEAE
jgi:hypothetical protein